MLRHLMLTGSLAAAGLAVTPLAPAVADGDGRDDTPWTLPETPPRCTIEQADSGDVAGCMIAFYYDPAETGWGAPPAPGVGPGWNWRGWT